MHKKGNSSFVLFTFTFFRSKRTSYSTFGSHLSRPALKIHITSTAFISWRSLFALFAGPLSTYQTKYFVDKVDMLDNDKVDKDKVNEVYKVDKEEKVDKAMVV